MTNFERAQEALTDADLAAHLIFHKGHGLRNWKWLIDINMHYYKFWMEKHEEALACIRDVYK